MDEDRRADAAAFCAARAAAAWADYWAARRAERPRRVRGAAWLRQEPEAAHELTQRWHAAALLIGLPDGSPSYYRRARRRRIARPFNRTAGEARRRMAEAPGSWRRQHGCN